MKNAYLKSVFISRIYLYTIQKKMLIKQRKDEKK